MTRTLTATIEDADGATVTTGPDSTLSVSFATTGGPGTVTGLGSATASNGVATTIVTGDLAGPITSGKPAPFIAADRLEHVRLQRRA